jgi:hypothetical protein
MKNSAAAPSGAAEKRRLKKLTKLVSIIFARYLASWIDYVASFQSAPLIRSLPFSQPFGLPVYLVRLPSTRFIMRSFVARRAE